jgi:hypothetical protein
MAWTTPDVYAAAQHMTAAVMNKISANLNALSTHTHSGVAGDGSSALVPVSITMGAGMLQQSKGAAIASISGSTLTIGSDGNYFNVTATGTINAISPTKQAGTIILLKFVNGMTINNGGLVLQSGGNWAAPAGSVLVLISDGSGAWTEVTRWVGGTIPKGNLWLRPSGAYTAAGVAIDPVLFPSPAPTGPYTPYPLNATELAFFDVPVPDDYAALVSAKVHYIGVASGARAWKGASSLGAVGAAYNAVTNSVGVTAFTSTLNQHDTVDVSGLLASLTAGMMGGLRFEIDTTSAGGIYLLGLAVQYTA